MPTLRSIPPRTFFRAALAALALVGAAAWPSLAQGESDWPQFQGGAAHTGVRADGPAPPYRELWRFHPPKGALSGAVLAGDVAVAVGTEAVYGLDLRDGSLSWQVARDGGPLSMPAVGTVGERQVVVYLDGPRVFSGQAGASPTASPSPSPSPSSSEPAEDSGSELVAVDLGDRSELWRVPLAETHSGVTIDGDHAFVGGWNGKVYAVDLASGTIEWTADAIGRVEAPVAVSDGRVYVVARDPDTQKVQLLALDEASGEEAWEYSPQAGAAAGSAPTTSGGTVVVGTGDRYVRGFSAEDGTVLWSTLALTFFSPASAPSIQSGSLFIADVSGGVYRLDPSDGARIWDHQLNDLLVRSSPVVSGGHVLVGTNEGRLSAIDIESGNLVWQSASSPGLIGAIALSPETLVAVKGGGKAGLVAFAHDPTGVLVDVPSPTVLDLSGLLGAFAVAFVVCAVVLYVPSRLLRNRLGPAFAEDEDEDEDEGEPDVQPGVEEEDRA